MRALLILVSAALAACAPPSGLDPTSTTTRTKTLVSVAAVPTSSATVPPTNTATLSTPSPVPSIVYYTIQGSTEETLRAQLDALRPVGYDGYPGDATTDWYVSWNWPGYGTTECDLAKATVSLDLKLILPRWTPPADVSLSLIAKWDDYTQALAEHEQGHIDHITANYLTVLDAIRAATCDTADAIATSALGPLRQFDIEYDLATDHGHLEGATFP